MNVIILEIDGDGEFLSMLQKMFFCDIMINNKCIIGDIL